MKRLSLAVLLLAIVSIHSCRNIRGQILEQPANGKKGYHYPYFLFLPEHMSPAEKLTLIVEPNNTGHVSDDFDDHLESAKDMIVNDGYLGKHLADQLHYPLVVPAFPRSEQDWKTYTHALDRDALNMKAGPLERIDLQLMAMVEDARSVLAELGYTVQDKFVITGFSASATFANRFTLIHPDKIQACAVGGLNGMLMLPLGQVGGTPLRYPLGTHDFYDLFGDSVKLDSLQQVPQFLFMGEEDDNDAVPYSDAYDDDEREIIHAYFGKHMLPDRWDYCSRVYRANFSHVTITTYPKIGHTITDEMRDDVAQFVKKTVDTK